ncbi:MULTISPECIES: MarR family winged helix-turn-helix transcriptional regulator [Anaerococcus]|uniref:MarR family winged helix-turn-helix transcriptional regulator n=1 Tax=Anaerococcus TaxID=165779 RepID=UPI0027B9B2AB|nr:MULTISPECIES: MarR family transcriptional regulator [Anaerococcus]MDU2557689.1 MarR family transcriptional regulator [Anaerococcus prevotii]MDU2584719.1 MarR family transcriptional regulator [Anaerococcus prevotii]
MEKDKLKILIGLHKNVKELDRRTLDIARSYGLSFSQFMVLEALYSKGNLSIGEVREAILSSVGTISLVVKNLEKMGYVKRKTDENDKRVSILSLTKEGRDVIGKVIPENETMIYDYMKDLSEEETKTLLGLLKKLGENIGN